MYWNRFHLSYGAATTSIVRRRSTIVSLDRHGAERILRIHTTRSVGDIIGITGAIIVGGSNLVFDPPNNSSPRQQILATTHTILIILAIPSRPLSLLLPLLFPLPISILPLPPQQHPLHTPLLPFFPLKRRRFLNHPHLLREISIMPL